MPTTFLLHLHLIWGVGFIFILWLILFFFPPLVTGCGGVGVAVAVVCLPLLHSLWLLFHRWSWTCHSWGKWDCSGRRRLEMHVMSKTPTSIIWSAGHREYIIAGPDSCLHFRFISALADKTPLSLFCCMHNLSSFFFFTVEGGKEH